MLMEIVGVFLLLVLAVLCFAWGLIGLIIKGAEEVWMAVDKWFKSKMNNASRN